MVTTDFNLEKPRNGPIVKQRKIYLEKIIRKNFTTVFKEYVKESSLGGVKEVFNPNIGWKERVIWIGLLVVMIGTMCYYLHYTWYDALSRPLIVSMETSTHPISKMDFPAVALCNTNRISRKALREFAERMYSKVALKNETMKQVEHFFLQYGRLLDYSFDNFVKNEPLLENMLIKGAVNTTTIMKQLSPKCEDMLLNCAWDKEVDCKTIFTTQLTIRGHCCIFNHMPEESTEGHIKRQLVPGALHGLRLVLDPMIEDYAYIINNIVGFEVMLFSSGHFADFGVGNMVYRVIEPDRAEFMELTSSQQRASHEVRKYSLQIRKCMFRNENTFHNEPYSYGNCLIQCRIKAILSLCKCTPYFLPNENQAPVCTLEDLKCLNKYREKFLYLYPIDTIDLRGLEAEVENSIFCDKCLPDCEHTKHFIKSTKIPISLNDRDVPYGMDLFSNINVTGKIMLSIYQPTPTGTLDRLDVVYYWFEILSNIGGFGGILLGFSILSGFEVVYYFFVRFLILTYKELQKTTRRSHLKKIVRQSQLVRGRESM